MKQLTFLLLLSIYPSLLFADFSRGATYNPPQEENRFEQRKRYLNAIHLIKTSQFSKLQAEKPKLRTYPLYPYLIYTEMSYRISRQTEVEINAFEAQHADTPLVEPLIQHWLKSLVKRNQWQTFTDHYDRVSSTKALACHYAYALHKIGRHQEAMDAATKLWTVGYSQPDECDPIFNVWRGQQGMTPDIAWERFSLSLGANEKKLSSYLMRFVDKKDKTFANNYRLVHLKPKTIERFSAFSEANARNREIILHGVRRLSRLDPVAAINALDHYESVHKFEPTLLETTYAELGRQLVSRTDESALADRLPIQHKNHPALLEARIRQSLRLADWSNVLVLINMLPEDLAQSDRWQYWRARVLAQSIDAPDQAIASRAFEDLTSQRSFYGFLAADIVGKPYDYQEQITPITQAMVIAMEATPGINRALELFTLGERSRGRREWYFSTKHFSATEHAVAAQVALRWGWHKIAIQTMINAGAWDELSFRFPLAYQDHFIEHARSANIPVVWGMAIGRQESAFMPDAKSRSGALGVMQLMPSTAKLVARKLGISYANNRSLREPGLNIKLGSHYLGQMLRRFDNNRILASAAYNAGPGRVGKWLNPDVPFDVWIEIIPYKETRGYVQNVLMFSSIYSRRMDDKQPLLYPHERDHFAPVQISTLPATITPLPSTPPQNQPGE